MPFDMRSAFEAPGGDALNSEALREAPSDPFRPGSPPRRPIHCFKTACPVHAKAGVSIADVMGMSRDA